MEPARNQNPLLFGKQNQDAERRRHGRLRCEELTCNIGAIRDLSAAGMQVFRKGSPIAQLGDELQVIIEYLDAAMPVNVKTVRVEKVGFRKRVYGFEFIKLSEEQRSRLTALARIASDKLTFAKRK